MVRRSPSAPVVRFLTLLPVQLRRRGRLQGVMPFRNVSQSTLSLMVGVELPNSRNWRELGPAQFLQIARR
jgi:hypothetical protein